MKRITLILLAIVMMLTIAACGKGNNTKTETHTPSSSSIDRNLTESEAKTKAENYLTSYENLKNLALFAHDDLAKVTISSIGTFTLQQSYTNKFIYIVKGRFYGYDSYGGLKGIYNFEQKIEVTDLSTHGYYPTISK